MPEALPPKPPVFSLADALRAPADDPPAESFAQLQAQADVVPHRPSVQDCPIRSCELTLVETDSFSPRAARVIALEKVDGTLAETAIDSKGHVVVKDVDVPLSELDLGLYVTAHEDGRETLEVEVRRTLMPEEPEDLAAEPDTDEGGEVEPPWLPFGDVVDD